MAACGSARRRRERRLRSWWRHEAQSVAAALATAQHHSYEKKKAVEHEGREVEEKGTNTALRGQLAPPTGTALFTLYDEEDAGGMRPGALPVLPEPQAALPRPTASSGPAQSLPRLGDEAPLRGEQELYSQHALLYRVQQGKWTLQGKGKAKLLVLCGKVRFMLQEEETMKVLSNFVVQGPDPYCELKPNAGRDNTWVWKIPGAGGDPEYFALKVASKELALKFKGIFEGARMLNDAATAARGIG